MPDEALDKLLNGYDIANNAVSTLEHTPDVKAYLEYLEDIGKLEMEIKAYTKTARTDSYESEWWKVTRIVRRTVTYRPDDIKRLIPEYAEDVIIEVVDNAKIKELLKDNLITDDQAESVSTVSENIAVSIKRSSKLKMGGE